LHPRHPLLKERQGYRKNYGHNTITRRYKGYSGFSALSHTNLFGDSLSNYNGILAVIGKSFVIHNLFSYSLLKELCVRESGLIYVLERPITYLIKHSNSIVIQREVGVDVDSFSEGVEEALFMHPDIIYISDIAIKDALNSVKKLFDIPVLTILSMTASSVEALRRSFEVFLKEDSRDVLRLLSKVIELQLDEEEKISFSIRDI